MRQIKFRSWHNVDGWCGAFSVHLTGLIDYGSGWMTQDEANMVLMQFTGLHDKNGKEIYEGDILGGYQHGEVVVKWDKDYACFSCYDLDDNIDYGLFVNQYDDCKKDWEVIGNIYENPELIK